MKSGPSEAKFSRTKKILSTLLVTGSLIWFGWLLLESIEHTEHSWSDVLPANYYWFSLAVIIGSASQYINVLIFTIFLRTEKCDIKLSHISKLYFTGQIIRYIPGRIFGIIYQMINTPTNISKSTIVLANIELMFVVFSGLVTASSAIVAFYFLNLFVALSILLIGFSIIALTLRKAWLSSVYDYVSSLLKKSDNSISFSPINTKNTAKVIILFVISWVIYLVCWMLLGKAGYGTEPSAMLILASTYSFSWLVGYLSMVTPSGLGVREAIFILLSKGLASTVELAIIAIVIRLWLMIIDFLLFLLFLPAKPLKK